MIRNRAGQSIGAQMTSASDGSNFAGVVTVFITGDNGVQTQGTVAGGVCTAEGNGYFSYAPAQVETDFDHIAFTFVGVGAITATVQVATITEAQAAAIGATGTMSIADVLADMLVVDNELQIGAGGADEARAISAIGMAMRAFEGVIANVPDLLGTVGVVSTIAAQENTIWPANLLRIDQLFLLDSNGRQIREIDVIQDVGGQTPNGGFWITSAATVTGAPQACYANRSNFYWRPTPDAVHNIRVYGLYSRVRPSVRSDTFQYPDIVALPCSVYAARLMEMGIDDPSEELKALAEEQFNPVIKALGRPVRQRPQSRLYSRVHDT